MERILSVNECLGRTLKFSLIYPYDLFDINEAGNWSFFFRLFLAIYQGILRTIASYVHDQIFFLRTVCMLLQNKLTLQNHKEIYSEMVKSQVQRKFLRQIM